MLATVVPTRRFAAIDPVLLVILPLAMAVAVVGPFDRNVHIITAGIPLLRVGLIAGLVLAGAACARGAGLSLLGSNPHWAWIGVAFAVGVAAYVCIVDALLFRNSLPLEYVREIQGHGLNERLSYYFLRAFQENVIYRLFVFSAVTSIISRIWRMQATDFSPLQAFAIAFAVQLVNVSTNAVWHEPMSAVLLIYELFRFVLPGALWGWLYWRFGFATTELGHVACHAFLQPALGMLL